VHDAPAPRTPNKTNNGRSHHRYTETTRRSARNGFNSCSELSPVTGLFCHRRLTDMAGPRPVGPTSPPKDLHQRRDVRTTRLHCTPQCPSSARPLSLTALATRPAIRSRASIAASTASRSNVRDDRETPLWCGTGWPTYRSDLSFGKTEYFYRKGLTGVPVICPSGTPDGPTSARLIRKAGRTHSGCDAPEVL
jgi:hypothetical protein